MDEQAQLKLQAYLDGELAQSERSEVEAWLARDAAATALLTEMRHTIGALVDFESEIRLPESREFYWSKIAREIERSTRADRAPLERTWFAAWRRVLVPAGAMAAVFAAGLFAVLQLGGTQQPESEMALTDTEVFTYRDYAEGMTLVWVSYPAESEHSDVAPYDTFD